jgi:hypothetical protein
MSPVLVEPSVNRTKIKRSLTAVGRHLKVKRQKDAQKAAEKAAKEVAAAALAQQAEAS